MATCIYSKNILITGTSSGFSFDMTKTFKAAYYCFFATMFEIDDQHKDVIEKLLTEGVETQ
jgi:hypothetical protein